MLAVLAFPSTGGTRSAVRTVDSNLSILPVVSCGGISAGRPAKIVRTVLPFRIFLRVTGKNFVVRETGG